MIQIFVKADGQKTVLMEVSCKVKVRECSGRGREGGRKGGGKRGKKGEGRERGGKGGRRERGEERGGRRERRCLCEQIAARKKKEELEVATQPVTPKILPRPAQPSEVERQHHMVNHLPPAPWCELCAVGRGKDDLHPSRENNFL